MTKSRKVVAMVLAFLMIFSSASVLASAWSAAVDDGFALDITTEFYKQVNGEWTATDKVRPGDTVKARVSIGTDYYSNNSRLLFFYDKTFFSTGYGGVASLEVNADPASFAQTKGIAGKIITSSPKLEADLINYGYVDATYLASHGYFLADVEFANPANPLNAMYDDSTWLFEFTMTVAADASGESALTVVPATIQGTSAAQSNAVINVPKGEATSTVIDTWPMWLWDAVPTLVANPVSTISSVTFNANGGAFGAEDTDTYVVTGAIDSEINAADIPGISREGYTFMGWVDADDATPTLAEVIAAPAQIPENDLELNAFWLDNVDITFNSGAGSAVAPHLNVTPYTDFGAVADPTLEGYTFMGWSTDGITVSALPATYPDVDTEYIAVWALDVTVSFNTNGGTQIAPIVGAAGTPFTAQIANPVKTGYYFVKWQPVLPTVFPAQDTTYNAIFEPHVYNAAYYVDGVLTARLDVLYGEEIQTELPNANIPAGYALSGWYTDSSYQSPFIPGTTMGTSGINLYAYTSIQTYDAVFVVDGESYATVPTVFGATIVAPQDPTKVGYVFQGWSPTVGEMDTAGDKYFYATWIEDIYTVSYYSEGELYNVYNISNGDELDIPADPYKYGYTFIGWDDSAEATTPVTLPQYLLTDEAEYYAVFTPNEYTASFYTNVGDTTPYYTTDVSFDSAIAEPTGANAPVKTGYTLTGWVDENNDSVTFPVDMDSEDGRAFYAVWEANAATYYVNVYYQDTTGTYPALPDTVLDFGANTNETVEYTIPEVTGFTADVANSVLTGTVPATGSLTLTAKYIRNTYVFTTDVDGAKTDVTYYYGADVATPATPVKTGYTFDSWQPGVPGTMPAADLTVYAQWEANEYEITYSYENAPDYGTAPALPATATATVEDTNVAVEPVPTLEGYTFNGWTTTDAAVSNGHFAMPAHDVAFTGRWVPVDYTVTYEYTNTPAYGTAPALPAQLTAKHIGDAVTVAEAPTLAGYTFNGWTTTDAQIVDGSFTMPAGNVTLIGSWSAIDYEVTYSYTNTPAYGTAPALPAAAAANVGDAITVAAVPTLAGYTFNGWTTTDAAVADGSFTMPAGDVEFVGSWSAIDYDVTYAYEGTVPTGAPAVPGAATANIGDEMTVASEPTLTGYTFSGWATADAAVADGAYTMPANAVAFTGTWSANTYDAVFMSNGALYDTVPTVFGQQINAPAVAPTRTGYTFGGWTPSVGIMDAEGKTFTAIWTANTYNAVFDAAGGYFDGDTTVTTKTVPTAFDSAIEAPMAPVRVGYIFSGWTPTVGNMDDVNGLTFTANWTQASGVVYRIVTKTMNTDGTYDEAAVDLSGTTDEFVDATPADIADGFTLNTADSTLTGNIAADGSLVLTVVIDRNSYDFTTDVDGETSTVSYLFGAAVAQPQTPEKTGYTFDEWSPAVPAAMPANDVTVVAQWVANTDTQFKVIAHYHNNITNADQTSQVILTGTTASAIVVVEQLPASPAANTTYVLYSDLPTVAHYELDTAAAGNEFTGKTVAADGSTVINVYYKAVQYTATFLNYEGGTFAQVTQAYGTAIVLPETSATNPYRYGYSFTGWNSVPPFMNANGTYSPIYEANEYTASFYTNVGDTTPYYTAQVSFDDSIAQPAGGNAPVKTGYTFAGWVDGANQAVTLPTAMDSEDGRAFYATWSANTDTAYTVVTKTMGVDGTYTEASETRTGTTDETADATPATVADGFALNTADSTLTGIIAADGSLVLTVVIDRVEYTVTTSIDGVTADYDFLYGAAVTGIANPTKTGYTFGGWYPALPTTMPANDVTVTATWAAALVNYTVNTYTMDTAGEYPTAPTAETKTGYTGDQAVEEPEVPTGFSIDPVSTLSATILPDGSTVLNVYLSRNQYTITTTVIAGETDEYTLYYAQSTAGIVPDPERAGFTFGGWSPEIPSAMPAADVETTAVWVANGYQVTYSYTGTVPAAAPAAPSVTAVTFGQTVTPAAVSSITGYTFSGWYYDGNLVTDGFTMPAHSVELTGYWTAEEFDAVFTADDADTPYEVTVPVAYGEAITAPSTDPVKAGFTFLGWSTDGTEANIVDFENDAPIMDENGIDFTAVWQANVATISYYVDDATEPYATETYNVGEAITPIAEPTQYGYVFSGWSTIPATMPVGGVTVTGSFTKGTFTVNFYGYAPSAHGPALDPTRQLLSSAEFTYEDAIVFPADPAITHYTFSGWNTADDGTGDEYVAGATMPGETLNLYAQFDRVTVRLIPKANSTTVITRGANANNSFVTGLATGMRAANYTASYLDVEGDGTITITRGSGGYGTGTLITVTDNVTGQVVETFYAVIYGDINGDARVNINDSAALAQEIGRITAWSRGTEATTKIPYLIKAADLNADRRVNINDKIELDMTLSSSSIIINQVTGLTESNA